MVKQTTYRDLSVDERREVQAARFWCIPLSAGTFVAWGLALFLLAMAIVNPSNPNSYGVGGYFLAPFFLALPFGIMNAIFIFPAVLIFGGFDFRRSADNAMLSFIAVTAIAIIWAFLCHSFQQVWYYTGPFCVTWALVFPPAMLGSAVTLGRCEKTPTAE